MTEIYRQIIDHPAAWTGPSIGGKDGLRYQLTPQHLTAIDEVLAKTRHIAPQAVTRAQFDHPALNPMLAEIGDILMNGRGALVITGVTRDRYSEEDFERIYFGFGTHWGTAVMQSSLGDKLGRVTVVPVGANNPTNRAYRSNEELTPHTDTNEIVGLMCVQKAAKGGHSQLASSLAVHNEIFRTRPDLLDALYEGYHYASREASKSGQPVTPYKVPVFCYVDGKVSSMCVAEFLRDGARKLGKDLPKKLAEGLDLYEQIAARDDIRVNFILEPGEMMVFNNFVTLHSRSSFEDGPSHKRNLMRLWLDLPKGGRPVAHEYWLKAEEYREAAKRGMEAAKGVAAAQ